MIGDLEQRKTQYKQLETKTKTEICIEIADCQKYQSDSQIGNKCWIVFFYIDSLKRIKLKQAYYRWSKWHFLD